MRFFQIMGLLHVRALCVCIYLFICLEVRLHYKSKQFCVGTAQQYRQASNVISGRVVRQSSPIRSSLGDMGLANCN